MGPQGRGDLPADGCLEPEPCADELGIPRDQFPDYLRSPNGAAMSAGWYFHHNNLARRAASPGWTDDSEAVNGGDIGLSDRARRCNAVVAELLRRGA
jgi:putative chitinase